MVYIKYIMEGGDLMQDCFQEFIEQTREAKTIDELVQSYLKRVEDLGYDRMIFCLMSDHSHIGLSAGVGYLNNYPEDWMKYYMDKGFDKIDPVIAYSRQTIGTFTWDEMSQTLSLTKKQKKCLEYGREASLFNGVCTPIWGPHRFSGIGLATSEKKDACDIRQETLDLINAYSNHFYMVFQRIHKKAMINDNKINNVFLTDRERDVLVWVARGKSNNDVADILSISLSCVKFHLDNIYQKLCVNDRVVACTKAIAFGLIHP